MALKKKNASPSKKGIPQSSSPDGTHDGKVPQTAGEAPASESELQLKTFEDAVSTFRGLRYSEARALFERAIHGPQKEVSHNARLHVMMCDRRLQAPVLRLETPDDHYDYAIERLNARDLESARRHLEAALELSDGEAGHVYYALAIHSSLTGDAGAMYEHLKRAIELDPKNRLAARQDPDLAAALQQPTLQRLLYPERNGSF